MNNENLSINQLKEKAQALANQLKMVRVGSAAWEQLMTELISVKSQIN